MSFYAQYPASSGSSSNASVGVNGASIPSDSTLVGAEDGSGNLQPLQVDVSGNLKVSASSLPLPSGAATAANQTNASQKSQIVDGSGNVISATTNALDVNIKSSGLSNQSVNLAQIAATTTATGNGVVSAGVQRVAVASDNTPFPIKIDQTTAGTTNAVSLAQIGSTTTAAGNGVVGAGVQRVAIASDNTAFTVNAAQSGTWTPTMPTLAANGTISATGVVFTAQNVAGYGQVSVQMIITSSATVTFEASNDNSTWVAVSMGFTTAGAPTTVASSSNIFWAPVNFNYFRVRCSSYTNGSVTAYMIATSTGLSSDPALRNVSVSNNVNVAQSGTWTVQPGNTANSTAWLVNNQVIPQSGSTNAASSAASTALASSLVIKGSAGRLLQLTGVNTKATGQYIQVFNATSAPADTTVPVLLAYVPSFGTFSFDFGAIGRYFATGITVTNSSTAATKTIGSADCWFNAEYL